MPKIWKDHAWDDYLYWQTQDKKTLKRINLLLKDVERNGYHGIGKPEPLKHSEQGWWSCHIDEQNRLIFRIEEGNVVHIASCRTHYEEN